VNHTYRIPATRAVSSFRIRAMPEKSCTRLP
jgi:hypothetical protein